MHKIFGGRLRSRVTCQSCGHNSDTFDRILDLSLDIFRTDTVREALKKFVAVDHLKGADKYKCEKCVSNSLIYFLLCDLTAFRRCNKPVNAEKRFTIHEAPIVLTVHLKRFSPLGRKIPHQVEYDEKLSLAPYMSEGSFGPTYSLYGVICHAGSGPNSGHYYAFVKSKDGRWHEMNDESVHAVPPPINKKSAYVLFYMRDKGQGLEAAMQSKGSEKREEPNRPRMSQNMKGMKRKERDMDDDEDVGEKVDKPLPGPLLPSPSINGDSKKLREDPQAAALKAKIQAAQQQKAQSTMKGLSQYASEGEDSDGGGGKENGTDVQSSPSHEVDIDHSRATPNPPPSSSPAPERSSIPPASFYGNGPRPLKKRKSQDFHDRSHQKRPFSNGKINHSNPYNNVVTYSGKNKRWRPPRGI